MTEHDARVESDLLTIDRTLAHGSAAATEGPDRELEELVLAVAAEAPEPDPAFAAELSGRVRAGFPRRAHPLRLPRPGWTRLGRPPMIALAGAASIVAAVAVVISLPGANTATESSGIEGGSAAAPTLSEERSSAGEGASDSQSAPSAGIGDRRAGFAPGARDRRIERSASLTLAAPADRLEQVANEIIAITDRRDGFVLRSSVSTGDDGASTGSFDLRVPAPQLQAALGELSELGDVRARTQAGQDATREFVSARDRLQGARAQKRSLLARLEGASSDTEAESIRRRLDLVSAEINGLRGRLRELRLRTDYATVAVTLQRTGDDDGSGGGGAGLGGALDDALRSLSDSVELIVRGLGVVLAPALLAGLAWAGARAARRRRREAALG